ncbi:alkaline phosphatase D family protein [Erythrobacter aureus]|uniref:alkaline phosphatase D family protein n=1 Tax=Erythrobacter aureus TaxID=2182384 RepID=UPI003A8F4FAA
MKTNRRSLLQLMTMGTISVMAGSAFAPLARAQDRADGMVFPEGVASADPEPESVIVWTRVFAPARAGKVPLVVQLSETPSFERVLVEQQVDALPDLDHTVRVAVGGLQPARHYYYRFLTADGARSETGRTRTAPDPASAAPFRFASVSCQNFQTGRYHAYRNLVERDRSGEAPLDFVLFLGDFIYELVFREGIRPLTLPGRSWETNDGISGRPLSYQYAESVEDYRYLYRTYLSDPWLRAARAQFPFLCIWDDHEFSNDCWQSMATYTDAGEPSQQRRVAASQAWFEYVPARLTGPLGHDYAPVSVENVRFGRGSDLSAEEEPNNRAAVDCIGLPRKLRWGALADIVLTDSRSYRSEPPVAPDQAKKLSLHARALLPTKMIGTCDRGRNDDGSAASESFEHDGRTIVNDRHNKAPGTMLGERQAQWLEETLITSCAKWKLCASSVPLMPLTLDFRYDLASHETVADEVALTIDSWEGYPAARSALLDYIASGSIGGTVFLSGDHHMHFAGGLMSGGRRVASEFCVAGISSTALGDVLGSFVAGEMAGSEAADLIGGPQTGPTARWINLSFLYGRDTSRRLLADLRAGTALSLAGAQRRLRHIDYLDVRSHGALTVEVMEDGLTGTYDSYDAAQLAGEYDTVIGPAYRVVMFDDGRSSPMAPTFDGSAPFPFDLHA